LREFVHDLAGGPYIVGCVLIPAYCNISYCYASYLRVAICVLLRSRAKKKIEFAREYVRPQPNRQLDDNAYN
jgi:hypothetical protein